MSEQARELTWRELRAAQAVVRGEPTDSADFAQLLGIDRPTAERLLRPGIHTPAMELVVLLRLVGRLRGSESSRDEIDEAIAAHRLLGRVNASTSAPDLTTDEIHAAKALLRGQDEDIGAASAFLSWSPGTVRHFLLIAGDSRALDSLLIATLLIRLHGRRVDVVEIECALLAIIERKIAEQRPGVAQ